MVFLFSERFAEFAMPALAQANHASDGRHSVASQTLPHEATRLRCPPSDASCARRSSATSTPASCDSTTVSAAALCCQVATECGWHAAGSYGGAPRSVLEAQAAFRDRQNANPDDFLGPVLPKVGLVPSLSARGRGARPAAAGSR